jgi:hypothetical protein
MRHVSEQHSMSLSWTAPGVVPALRMLMFALALTALAGCGQKGDLNRPDKSQKPAAFSAASS